MQRELYNKDEDWKANHKDQQNYSNIKEYTNSMNLSE